MQCERLLPMAANKSRCDLNQTLTLSINPHVHCATSGLKRLRKLDDDVDDSEIVKGTPNFMAAVFQ